ncbi:MAG: ATP-binding protein [Gemmatimonadota bacterium]|nr:ATP-binding protein [Gemmatimonadota bacterium]
MQSPEGRRELIVSASVGRHLAFAPVAFAVTEGPAHVLLYANSVFRALQAAGKISIGERIANGPTRAADLTPLLDGVFHSAKTVRDAIVEPTDDGEALWSCTVWPVPGSLDVPEKLVVEVRDVELVERVKIRQRAVAERLLLGALHEQDLARDAVEASHRARFVANASLDLSLSLDETATRDAVRHLALPRPGTWCIVDVMESNGGMHRLAVVHPDQAKQALARQLVDQWPPEASETIIAAARLPAGQPAILTKDSGSALLIAAHGAQNLLLLREIGFSSLLVVPLIVRARFQGAITFVSPEGDPPFTAEEVSLASDLAARCAMALDNARLYREADALRLAAEMANQSKGDFLGAMSHELRTPLNAIGGFTELIEMGLHGPVTEQQRTALARVKANQQHLLALITEILNFVRVESGRMEYRSGPMSIRQALVDAAEMLSGAIHDKGLTLDGPGGETDVEAWADQDRVRQILVNLIMNAVKYTALQGGTISLSCEVGGDMSLAHVADTGPGIPANKLETIFEPFVQLSASMGDRQGGVGLGLAISRDLARGMDGDLSVESTLGVGSRFTLSLPRPGVRR